MKLTFLTNNEKIKIQVASFLELLTSNSSHFEVKTSGSTGEPKTILIKKEFAFHSAKATLNFLNINEQDNALLCLSTDTIGGKMMLIRANLHNLHLLVVEPSANPLKNSSESIDFMAIAPIQLHTILVENPEKLKSIRSIIVGGGMISDSTIELLKQHQITVYQTFGMTETISHIALRKVGFENEEYYSTLENIHVYKTNNQLVIKAPTLGIDALTTNDLIELKNEHQFKWMGRADFVINSGGVKIQIEALENELHQKIKNRFFITSGKDERLGQKVILVVEGAPANELEQKSFYSFLKNKYHVPKEIVFVEHFEYSKSDKINRIATLIAVKNGDFKQVL
jgi:O-succinylbenzoic acid--CoA ligase